MVGEETFLEHQANPRWFELETKKQKPVASLLRVF